jgi:dimethylamine/trimethylamine dehydrogenase
MNDHFSILFESVKIGPVVAPNRFYQVPHCNGMGYRMPHALTEMRKIKAQGGWGVVCTEEVEIHHSSDLAPNIEGRIWDDADIPTLAQMVDAVHNYGALAGIELTHGGRHAANLYSRSTSLAPVSIGFDGYTPGQTHQMDKEDIRNLRRWHRQAALRAKQAGFDIIYCYAGHNLSLAMHFLLRRYNQRTDEYGGSLENRTRFLREIIEDTQDAVGDHSAVAVRLAVDELMGEDGMTAQGEGHDIVALLAELPDLWDVNISDWSHDSAVSRFEHEGYQEKYIRFVKSLTSKPVVGVGRYTTPEAMLSVVQRGIVDLVGAARPSIADPFLPQKIKEGRIEDIRECIGCNICASADNLGIPIRCTQNPTMGEEWRRGWHPEIIPPKKSDQEIMVIGAGPAGLECARALGARGYHVSLLDERREFGGRVILESALPGLIEWRRVVDWRLSQIKKMNNVTLYPGSQMDANDVIESGVKHIIVATGAQWRRDGVGRHQSYPIPGYELSHVYTPDDLMMGKIPTDRVLVYDDDHYYIGSVLAELLLQQGCRVTLVTPAPLIAYWSQHTLEQEATHRRLIKLGAEIITQKALKEIHSDDIQFTCTVTGQITQVVMDAIVLVTDRLPNDALYRGLKDEQNKGKLESLRVIGDAEAPHIIAQAIFSGHRAARAFEEVPSDETPFKIERGNPDFMV